jgi:hypothetical protein
MAQALAFVSAPLVSATSATGRGRSAARSGARVVASRDVSQNAQPVSLSPSPGMRGRSLSVGRAQPRAAIKSPGCAFAEQGVSDPAEVSLRLRLLQPSHVFTHRGVLTTPSLPPSPIDRFASVPGGAPRAHATSRVAQIIPRSETLSYLHVTKLDAHVEIRFGVREAARCEATSARATRGRPRRISTGSGWEGGELPSPGHSLALLSAHCELLGIASDLAFELVSSLPSLVCSPRRKRGST